MAPHTPAPPPKDRPSVITSPRAAVITLRLPLTRRYLPLVTR